MDNDRPARKKKKLESRSPSAIRWWAVGLHSFGWVALAFTTFLLASAVDRVSVSMEAGTLIGGVFVGFGCAMMTLLIAYHIPNLSRWTILMPVAFSLTLIVMAVSLRGFDGSDRTRAYVVVGFWIVAMFTSLILPLLIGGELRPVRALVSIMVLVVVSPIVTFLLLMAGVWVYFILFPGEFEIIPIEAIFISPILPVAIVPSLIALFIIRQINVTRSEWRPIHVRWRFIGGRVMAFGDEIKWVFVAGHFVAWLVLAGLGMSLFYLSINKAFPNLHMITAILLFSVGSAVTALLISHHIRRYSLWIFATPVCVMMGLSILAMALAFDNAGGGAFLYPALIIALIVCTWAFVLPFIALDTLHWRRGMVIMGVLIALFVVGLNLITGAVAWVVISLFYRDVVNIGGEPFAMGITVAFAVVSTLTALLIIQQLNLVRSRNLLEIDTKTRFVIDTDGELTQDLPPR
ncbi:MAG: hypothetical protein RLP44_19525 [Aggregatilineales bacterium]